MDVKDAMQQASVKLRDTLGQGNSVSAPNASQSIQIDPVMASYFDLQAPDVQMAEQVKDIQDFLSVVGYKPEESIQALREIELKLGGNQTGTNLDKIHRYVKLKNQALSLHKQAEAMEK